MTKQASTGEIAFDLVVNKGWTQKQVAEHLDKSPGTISSALKKERQKRQSSTEPVEPSTEQSEPEVEPAEENAEDPGSDDPAVAVELRPRHHNWLKKVAEAEGRSVADIIRMLVARAYASDPYRHGQTGGTVPGKKDQFLE